MCVCVCVCICVYIYTHICMWYVQNLNIALKIQSMLSLFKAIYIYISVATLAYFCYSCPTLCQLSSQPVVRGPKVSHHSCYCMILHCIAQIDKCTLHGVFFL